MIPVEIMDGSDVILETNTHMLDVQNHPKDPSEGTKKVRTSPKILIEKEDAERLSEGQNATFINWGNLMIVKINKHDGNVVDVRARLNLEDKNYKNTLKITWLAAPVDASHSCSKLWNPIRCYAVYFDHIISAPILGKDDDFKNFVTENTRVKNFIYKQVIDNRDVADCI